MHSNFMSTEEFTKRFHASITEIADDDIEYTFKTNHVSTGKPSASGIGSCARKQWYSLTNTPATEPPGLPWASMMGFAGEAIVRETLWNMGYTVEKAELPTDLPYSGSVDDVLHGLDLDQWTLWDNKVRGAYGMRVLIRDGLPKADADMYVQMQCVDPSTPVLKADLTWSPIGDLSVGDQLFSFTDGKSETARRLTTTSVEAVRTTEDLAFALHTASGRTIIASKTHKFLSYGADGKGLAWRTVETLMRPYGKTKKRAYLADWQAPWSTRRSFDDGWVSGILDGEGCVTLRSDTHSGTTVGFTQNEGEVLTRGVDLLRTAGYEVVVSPANGQDSTKIARVNGGIRALMKLLGEYRPMRLLSKFLGKDDSYAMWLTPDEIVDVTPLGVRTLVDIQTGTGTFLADGYASHNCYMKALEVSQCIITVVPHDLSIMRREIKSYKLEADPLIHRIILYADEETQACAATRATELTAAKNLGVLPRREFNPMDKRDAVFPCGYCEWRTQCVVDDLTKDQLDITPLPKWADTIDLEATVGASD